MSRVCYCSREDVQRSPDFKDSAGFAGRIDRAIQSVSDIIEDHLHRTFYPADTTYKFDWPGGYSAPWRLWLNQWDLLALTQVQSPQGTTIPLASVIPRPVNRKPGRPYRYIELDRSASAFFNAGSTPQLAIWVTGTWGFCNDTDAAGTLTAAVSSAGATSIAVSDASKMGVGNLLVIGTERLLVTGRTFADTSVSFGGVQTADDSDQIVSVPDATLFAIGEELRIDSERLLITDIMGNFLIVTRGWNGSLLGAHTGGTIYAARSLTVARGQYGSTAATHLQNDAVTRHRVPPGIRDLAIAESINRVLQETGGYSRTTGEADAQQSAPGDGLAGLWDEAMTSYGRKARSRAV